MPYLQQWGGSGVGLLPEDRIYTPEGGSNFKIQVTSTNQGWQLRLVEIPTEGALTCLILLKALGS